MKILRYVLLLVAPIQGNAALHDNPDHRYEVMDEPWPFSKRAQHEPTTSDSLQFDVICPNDLLLVNAMVNVDILRERFESRMTSAWLRGQDRRIRLDVQTRSDTSTLKDSAVSNSDEKSSPRFDNRGTFVPYIARPMLESCAA